MIPPRRADISRRAAWTAAAAALLMGAPLHLNSQASKASVIGSKHDLAVPGATADICGFCHISHNGYVDVKPLWNHTVSAATYTTYTSTTMNGGAQTPTAGVSKTCLSCHDGTIALGSTLAKGVMTSSRTLTADENLGTDLRNDHPLSFVPVDDGQLASTLFQATPASKDATVKLVSGRIECTTCHDPHKQNYDAVQQDFLVRSNSAGAICLACHDPSRAQPNWLNGWTSAPHSTATNTVPATPTATFGPYGTVAANACGNCHRDHSMPAAAGPRLLRASEEAACSPCHSGTNLTPALRNVMTEFTKLSVHPATTVSGAHDAAEAVTPVNATRHAECPDCHNSHAASATGGAAAPPGLQAALLGASGFDGGLALRPASNEYQVCFKCHSTSTNKPQGPTYTNGGYRTITRIVTSYDERTRFNSTVAYHNVTKVKNTTLSIPSLRTNMLTLSGGNSTRTMGTGSQIYCTDCHSNNQNRNFGGTGPNGPHGSAYPHVLERRMEMEPLGGGGVAYVAGTTGTYALCDKCHNIATSILSNVSFTRHSTHISSARTSCTTCHDPHGIAGGSATNNKWLINFDTSIVSNSSGGIRRYESTGTRTGRCYLTCHGKDHNPYTY